MPGSYRRWRGACAIVEVKLSQRDSAFSGDRVEQICFAIFLKYRRITQLVQVTESGSALRWQERGVSTLPRMFGAQDFYWFTGFPMCPVFADIDPAKVDPFRSISGPGPEYEQFITALEEGGVPLVCFKQGGPAFET